MGAAAVPIAMGLNVAGGTITAIGEAKEGASTSKYYKYLAAINRENAVLSEAAGKGETSQLGQSEFQGMQQLVTRKGETIGAQKAALATGAGVGSKTAEQIVSDTINKTEMDEEVLRYNTDLKMKNVLLKSKGEAMNYRAQAGGYDLAAKNAKSAAKWKMWSTILGTAASTAYMAKDLGKSPSTD